MKYRYTRYTGDLLDEIDLEDLVAKLSDLLMASGFSNPWGDPSEGDEDRSMDTLHDAILEALFSDGVLSDEALQQLLGEPADGDQEGARDVGQPPLQLAEPVAPGKQLAQDQRRPALGKHLGAQRHRAELAIASHVRSLGRSHRPVKFIS